MYTNPCEAAANTLLTRRSPEKTAIHETARLMEDEDHIDQSPSPFADDSQSQSSLSSSELLAINLAFIEAEDHENHYDRIAETESGEEQVKPLSIDLLSLPVDIVALIFCYACEPIRNDALWSRQCYPFRLASICQVWRQLALSLSELWTTIVVRASQAPGDTGYIVQTELLQQWLERTKGRSIKVFFGPSLDLHLSRLSPSPLLQLLVRHCQQWEIAEFHLRPCWYDILRLATESRTLSLTNLRSVTFGSFHDASSPYFARLSTFNFTGAAFLQNLSLIGYALERTALTLTPNNQITSISLVSCWGIRLQDLCQKFQRLRSASFISSSIIISHLPCSLDRLKHLTVVDTSDYIQYFRQLTLPALSSLEFRLRDCLVYTQTFLQFLTRSGCLLTSLTLECFITMEYDLIDFLQELPTLEELHIIESAGTPGEIAASGATGVHPSDGLGPTFFELLNPDEVTPYLPNLMIFSYEGILAVQAIDFMEPFIVRSRMREGVRGSYETEKVAILQKATIVANQYSNVADFSIAEYSDPMYIWEIARMVEEGVLTLKNMDGSPWE